MGETVLGEGRTEGDRRRKESTVRRLLLLLGLGAAILALAGGTSAATAKARFQLKGEVYPNATFKIELKTAAGRRVKTLPAGTYRIKIEDVATVHNFHLKGPGVNKATSVSRRVETIWTVRLRHGRYTFLCDPHAGTMHGSFRVT
jgi:plastocyanin